MGCVGASPGPLCVCVCVCPEKQLDEEAYARPSVSNGMFHVVTWMKNTTAVENRNATERVRIALQFLGCGALEGFSLPVLIVGVTARVAGGSRQSFPTAKVNIQRITFH